MYEHGPPRECSGLRAETPDFEQLVEDFRLPSWGLAYAGRQHPPFQVFLKLLMSHDNAIGVAGSLA